MSRGRAVTRISRGLVFHQHGYQVVKVHYLAVNPPNPLQDKVYNQRIAPSNSSKALDRCNLIAFIVHFHKTYETIDAHLLWRSPRAMLILTGYGHKNP
uniref:Uncharacterized protein n=1 Tax=Moorena producens (strain JHB) TaxID=1454205 RepID=A0A1D9G0I2_MOOP1